MNIINALLADARPYCEYGPDYSRDIATAANDLRRAVRDGYDIQGRIVTDLRNILLNRLMLARPLQK